MMSGEERERWAQHARLQQLILAEARAWKRFAWGGGIYFGLMLLMPLGLLLAGASVYNHVTPSDPGVFWLVGMVLQGISSALFWLLAIPLLLRFVRWIGAMWRRRRFSSTPQADRSQRERGGWRRADNE